MEQQNYTIALDPLVARFFQRISEKAEISVEQVLSDALFQYAGKLAVGAIKTMHQEKQSDPTRSIVQAKKEN